MTIVTNQARAVPTALALVLACQTLGQPAHRKGTDMNMSGNAPAAGIGDQPSQDGTGKYAIVNGLKMYYEINGTGKPLVVLHGAFGWATAYPTLAKNRQVIAVELQGHGHTADIDRPLTIEQMADDTAAFLKHLKIEQADFFGY